MLIACDGTMAGGYGLAFEVALEDFIQATA
jgi:hypothetical protein